MFIRYLNFCPEFFGHARKRLDKKTLKVHFRIHAVINYKKKHNKIIQ